MQQGFQTPKKSGAITPRSFQKYDGKCVCQICTCGKDKCPPKEYHVNPNHFQTTNKKDYQTWNVKQTERKKPNDYLKFSYCPTKLVSSYNQDYTAQKSFDKSFTFKPQDNYFKQPFVGDTEYHQKFQKFNQYTTPVKQQYQYISKSPNKNHFDSTYHQDYKVQPLSKSQILKPQEDIIVNQVQFQGKTQYQEEFTPQKPIKSQPYIPLTTQQFGGMQFEKKSLYQQEYPQYNSKIYEKQECPVRKLPQPKGSSPNKHIFFSAQKNQWE